MWLKFSFCNIDEKDKYKFGKRFSYLNQQGKAEKIYHNFDFDSQQVDTKKLTKIWYDVYNKSKTKIRKGRPVTRFFYSLCINLGVPKQHEKLFLDELQRFVNTFLSKARAVIFIHRNTRVVHSHFLIHSIDIEDKAIRITKGDINLYKEFWRKFEKEKENLITNVVNIKKKRDKKRTIKNLEKKKKEVSNVYKHARNFNMLSVFDREDTRDIIRKGK